MTLCISAIIYWWWKEQDCRKHSYISTSLYGATSYKTMTLRVTTMKTSQKMQSKFATSVRYKDGQTCVRFQVLTVVLSAMWHCAVGQEVTDTAMEHCAFIFQVKQHSCTACHSDEGTIILQNVSNGSSNNTASHSKMLESSWAYLFMIKDLVYHNHLWSSHSSARRWTVWVQKPLILRHYEVVHGRWISLEGLYSQHQNAERHGHAFMPQVCQFCNEFWNTE